MTKRMRLDLNEAAALVPDGAGMGPPEPPVDIVLAFNDKGVMLEDDLAEHLEVFRNELRSEQENLLADPGISYKNDDTWVWLVDNYKNENREQVESILALLFGVFLRMGCVHVCDDNKLEFVNVFFPNEINGKTTEDRGKAKPFYQDKYNPSVYLPVKNDIMYFITCFVLVIKRLGYFVEGSEDYFAPARIECDMHIRLAKRILGDDRVPMNALGGFLPSDGYGIRTLPLPDRCRWAVGDVILYVRDPMERQDWDKHVFKSSDGCEPENKDQYILQLMIEDPDETSEPMIPGCRYYRDVDSDIFRKLCKAVNGIVYEFTALVDQKKPDFELQAFVCSRTVDMIHYFCPSFMSYIGAQYLQRICRALQGAEYAAKDPAIPRAYFASPDFYVKSPPGFEDEDGHCRYIDLIEPGEERLVASFVEVFGSMFFSTKTYISAFVGEEGSGKNFVRKLAVHLAGGDPHTFRIDINHGKFSMSMLKPWTNLLVVEDAGKGQVDIPSGFMDSALGGTRGQITESAVVEKKFGHPFQQKVIPMGCCYLRNEPTEDAKQLAGRSRQEKAIACIQGTGGGRNRRVRLAPPLMVQVYNGTLNGIEVCAKSGIKTDAFNADKAIEELPFVMAISWMTTILGDLCRDDIFGLIGDGGNDQLDRINAEYMSMGKADTNDNIYNIVSECESIKIASGVSTATSITLTYGVSSTDLKKAFYTKYKKRLKSIPEEFGQPKSKVYMCPDCHRVYLGLKPKKDQFQSKIVAIRNASTSEDRNALVEMCSFGDEPCYKKAMFKNQVVVGYKLKDVD